MRRAALAAALGAALAFAAPGGPAVASADVTDTSPRASSVLEGAPTEIVIDLDEAVEQELGTVELFDAAGVAIPLDGFVDSGDASQVVAPVADPSVLGAGVYVVVYRLVGRDGQPLAGAFTFQIGTQDASQRAVLLAVTSGQPTVGTERAVGWAFGALRFLATAGVVVLIGAWALVGGRRSGAGPLGRHARPVALSALVVAVVGALGSLALQGPRVLGTGLADAFDASTLADVAGTRFGIGLVLRLGLLALAVVPTLGMTLAGRGNWLASALTVGVGLVLTFAATGHPVGGRWAALGVVLAALHVGALAMWLGAVVTVLAVPSSAGQRRVGALTDTCVPVVVVSGLLQVVRMLPDADALSDTTFGRTVVAKTAVVVLLVAVAAMARPHLRGAVRGPARSLVATEAVLGVALLAVSAGLTSVPPDRLPAAQPVVAVVSQSGVTATLTVTPGRAGMNDLHLTVAQPPEVTEPVASAALRLALVGSGVPAAGVAMEPEGPDHFSAYGVALSTAGTWQIDILVTDAAGATVALTTTVDVART